MDVASLIAVVRGLHPALLHVAPALVETFLRLRAATGSHDDRVRSGALTTEGVEGSTAGGEAGREEKVVEDAPSGVVSDSPLPMSRTSEEDEAATREAAAAADTLQSARCALGSGRQYSSRDLLKWCARVDASVAAAAGKSAILPAVTSPQFTQVGR